MRLKEIIKNRGFTQTELALRMGKKQQTISCWANGVSSPSPKDSLKLAKVLQVDLEKILECFTEE